MGEIVGIYTKKGGIGKSHGIANISTQMALNKKKVLVIDGDPQRNLTQFFLTGQEDCFDGLKLINKAPTLFSVLDEGINIYNTIIGVDFEVKRLMKNLFVKIQAHVDLIPGTPQMDDLDTDSLDVDSFKKQLLRLKKEYDYILIDFPPATNDLTVLYLCACDYLIVPFELGRDSSLSAYWDVMNFCDDIKKSGANPDLEILGVYFNKVQEYKVSHKESLVEFNPLKKDLKIFDTYIPYAFKPCNDAEEKHQPLCICCPRAPITKAYESLTAEICEKIGAMKNE